jgi:Uma2 family endonuclease
MAMQSTSSASSTGWTGPPIVISGAAEARASRSEFYQFCLANPQLRIERTADGDLHIMPPTGGETGRRNHSIAKQLGNWCDRDGTGIAFDSSTGFWLPNGAERAPVAAWVRLERWHALSEKEREEFPPLAPDFVAELRSKSERLPHLRAKMIEYVDNGVRLAWLIDPETRQVEVYRPGQSPVVLDNPTAVIGDPELPGFVLDLSAIW